MKHQSLAIIVLALAVPPTLLAQPELVALSYSTKEVMPIDTRPNTNNPTVISERPGQSRRDRARVLNLTYQQKQALVLAYRAGDHYGIGLLFAAIVYQESKLCKFTVGDHGKAHGCAQLHEGAVKAVTGVTLAAWELTGVGTQELNLAIGARYLDLCLQRFGYPRGISCYNTGVACAAQPKCKPRIKRAYTQAVLANMKRLERLPQNTD